MLINSLASFNQQYNNSQHVLSYYFEPGTILSITQVSSHLTLRRALAVSTTHISQMRKQASS